MSEAMPGEIKDRVRDHYSEAIRVSTSACCGAPRKHDAALYGAELLAEMPADVVAPSYGCGNPFAVADLKPGEVVLDLGSGAGLDLLLAAARVGEHGRVFGLDMTDEMLAVAAGNLDKAGARNVILLRGDLESVPLPNHSVDVIISNCVVNLTPDKGSALAEAFRVLRTGGRFAISDIVVTPDLAGLPVSEPEIRAGITWAGCFAGALTTAEWRTALERSGFERVEIEIQRRYTVENLRKRMSPELTALPEPVLEDLAGRFASSLIFAVKRS
jgi:ubiquinone/menaquinone biosynthesis C-methylase UbiE